MKRTVVFILVVCCLVASAYTLCFKSITAKVSGENELKIVVDAGHGGMDGGVTGVKTGEKESNINLKIAFALSSVLEDAGFQVTMTRKTEYGLTDGKGKWSKRKDMQIRKEIIQNSRPSLVLSIHQNFYPTGSARGGQVFYLKGDENAKRLALCVQESLNGLYAKRGVKGRVATPSKYYILNCSSAPSIIVECGFLSSATDDTLLAMDTHRIAIAKSIFSGVARYYSMI